MDDSGNGYLDLNEFNKAMAETRMTEEEAEVLFSYFDVNGDGEISYDEFLASLRVRSYVR